MRGVAALGDGMRNERISAARNVANSLFVAEKDLDAALGSAAGLISRIVEAGDRARLPAVIGQGALDALGDAVASLIETRRKMIEAHGELATASEQIGLGAVAWGDQYPKPPPSAEEGRQPRMRVVGSGPPA